MPWLIQPLLWLLTAVPSHEAESPVAEPAAEPFVVHEWGTFTTVVDESGKEMIWNALAATSPLPDFVHTGDFGLKASLWTKVRMETPVLYFHTDRELTLDVEVAFPLGTMTEWYPAAAASPIPGMAKRSREKKYPRILSWSGVQVSPEFNDMLRTELGGAHYYAARGVGCAQLRMPIEDPDRQFEAEKFLFYRGVGDFQVPLTASIEEGRLRVESRSDYRIDQVMVFRREGAGFAYDIECYLPGGAIHEFDLNNLPVTESTSLDDLKKILRGQGLYEDEAQAMIETWRQDWFDPGLRVFYTVPKEDIDRLLPLKITPQPDAVQRALIGRVEVMDVARRDGILAVVDQVQQGALDGTTAARQVLADYGRGAAALLGSQSKTVSDPHRRAAMWEVVSGITEVVGLH